jgi:hypothetical protein
MAALASRSTSTRTGERLRRGTSGRDAGEGLRRGAETRWMAGRNVASGSRSVTESPPEKGGEGGGTANGRRVHRRKL